MGQETTNENWRQTCHPDMLKVLAYWQSKCGDRSMPSRTDIDPLELAAYLPQITLVDVVTDNRRFVYRLVGTAEVRLRGKDPTGQAVVDGFFAATPAGALNRYERVCRTCTPFYEEDDFQAVDRYVSEANLFLPLSNDGKTVNMIMVFSINRDLYL
ncbi:MAG TPA: PAS domain-containing protein [Dongiaceae bacterium]|nr:PAS domain-containing protein [Dongiaceae bacterium]